MRRVGLFLHTYMPSGALDPFMQELVQGFRRIGVEVYLFITNEYVDSLGAQDLKIKINKKKLLDYIASLELDFILSSNHGLVFKELKLAAPCKIVNWLVDLIPFSHDGDSIGQAFSNGQWVITSSSAAIPQIRSSFDVESSKVLYLPFASAVSECESSMSAEKSIEICFVGSYFSSGDVGEILSECAKSEALYGEFLDELEDVRSNYQYYSPVRGPLLKKLVNERFKINDILFRAYLANIVSQNSRASFLKEAAPYGLNLYGNIQWLNTLESNSEILHAFRPTVHITTKDALKTLYESSKISLNISHRQALGGLPYRVFDILRSSSLLLSDSGSKHDFELIFGKTNLPFYDSIESFRFQIKRLLSDDVLRSDLVAESNELVAKGHTFEDRIKQMYEQIAPGLLSVDCSLNETSLALLHQVKPDSFYLRLTESPIESMAAVPVGWLTNQARNGYLRGVKNLFKRYLPASIFNYIKSRI